MNGKRNLGGNEVEEGRSVEGEFLSQESTRLIDRILNSIVDDPVIGNLKERLMAALHHALLACEKGGHSGLTAMALRIADKLVAGWASEQSDEVKACLPRIMRGFSDLLSSTETTVIIKRRPGDVVGMKMAGISKAGRSWESLSMAERMATVGSRFAQQIREIINNFAAIDGSDVRGMDEYMKLGDEIVAALAQLGQEDLEVAATVSATMVAAVRNHFGMKVDFCVIKKPDGLIN